MINISQEKRSYIKDLLLSRIPTIYTGKYSLEDLTNLTISIFAETFAINFAIANLNHPDVLILGSRDKLLSIKDCRSVKEFVSKRPFAFSSQLVLIRLYENLRDETWHTLLKVLEDVETANYNICIVSNNEACLSANFVQGFLETVLSRCAIIYVGNDESGSQINSSLARHLINRGKSVDGISSNGFIDMCSKMLEAFYAMG